MISYCKIKYWWLFIIGNPLNRLSAIRDKPRLHFILTIRTFHYTPYLLPLFLKASPFWLSRFSIASMTKWIVFKRAYSLELDSIIIHGAKVVEVSLSISLTAGSYWSHFHGSASLHRWSSTASLVYSAVLQNVSAAHPYQFAARTLK